MFGRQHVKRITHKHQAYLRRIGIIMNIELQHCSLIQYIHNCHLLTYLSGPLTTVARPFNN